MALLTKLQALSIVERMSSTIFNSKIEIEYSDLKKFYDFYISVNSDYAS